MARTFTWAAGSGAYDGSGNWDDISSGTAVNTTAVPIATDTAYLGVAGVTVTGPGATGTLRVTAAMTLGGTINFGSLDVAASLDIAAGGTLGWASSLATGGALPVSIAGTLSVAAVGARLRVRGTTSAWAYLQVGAGAALDIAGGGTATIDVIDLVGQGAAAATFVVDGGGSVAARAAVDTQWLAVGDGGTGSATLTGGALVVANRVTVGFSETGGAGGGTLRVQGSATLNATGYADLGDAAGDSGTLLVTGPGSAVASAGLFVGNVGIGAVSIEAGATLTTRIEVGDTTQFAGAIANGVGSGGGVVVSGAGSVWRVGGRYTVGGGGAATLSLLDGAAMRFSAVPQATVANGVTSYAANLSLGSAQAVVADATLDLGAGALWVGAVGTASLAVSAGGQVVAASPAVDFAAVVLGLQGGVGSLALTGAGSGLTALGQLDVGGAGGGSGTLSIGVGATLASGADPADAIAGLVIADAVGSTGVVSVAGAGASLTNSGRLDVGRYGAGRLLIGAGGVVQTVLTAAADTLPGGILVGANAGASGSIDVAGAGALLATQQTMLVGMQAAGTLSVSAGGMVSVAGTLGIATRGSDSRGGGASGLVAIDHATLSALGDLWVGERSPGYRGTGTLAIGSGALVEIGGNVTLEANSRLSVAGGMLEVGGTGAGIVDAVWVADGFSLIGDGGVAANVVSSGTVAAQGGLLTVNEVQGNGTLAVWSANATLDIGTLDGGTLDLASNGTLRLHAPPGALVSLLVGVDGGTIDMAGAVVTGARYSAGALLLRESGGGSVSIALAASPPPGALALVSDGAGGTDVVLPCFAAGTRIRTLHGDVAVETLRPGDHVLTAAGRWRPVLWVGLRRLDCGRHARPWDVHPVRVCAGALAPGVPARDLLLSPDHALLVAGALVPVRYLLNGVTVVQAPVGRITYAHVELDAHDLLLAEGAPAESFLDTGNRAAFAGAGAMSLHPDFARATWETKGCAKLVTAGPELLRARRALLTRAGALGHRRTRHPALRLRADATDLRATVRGAAWSVALPAGTQWLHLLSRDCVPAQSIADAHDTRRLGVAVAEVSLDGRKVALDDAVLAAGWHAPEPGWRWTCGAATLAVAGARHAAFRLALTGRYWTSAATSRPIARLQADAKAR